MFRLNRRKKEKKLQSSKIARNLITISDTKSIILEQFRTIRTNITFSLPNQELKTILITSATPGEGKSTNAANIGIVFAQDGKRVLIVDADMRKPTLHETFKTFNKVGLSNVTVNRASINEAIQETFIVGLNVITSGPIPPNPAELLSSKAMDELLLDVKKDYDIIIFDSPPLLSVTDAQILSNKCDGTLLVINAGVVQKEAVQKAKEILSTSHSKILGAILNNYVTPKQQNYYKAYS